VVAVRGGQCDYTGAGKAALISLLRRQLRGPCRVQDGRSTVSDTMRVPLIEICMVGTSSGLVSRPCHDEAVPERRSGEDSFPCLGQGDLACDADLSYPRIVRSRKAQSKCSIASLYMAKMVRASKIAPMAWMHDRQIRNILPA
jgi:hypothetical protein